MTQTYMTIREMCDAFQVTPRTLRFYESKELLNPVREGTRRLFTKRDRARLKLILRGKRFGFSLEEIRQLLDLYDRDDQAQLQLEKSYSLAKIRREDLVQRRDELSEAIADLEDQMRWAEETLAEMNKTQQAAE